MCASIVALRLLLLLLLWHEAPEQCTQQNSTKPCFIATFELLLLLLLRLLCWLHVCAGAAAAAVA